MQLRPDELPLVCDLVRELCGIALDDGKTYLIENRLSAICEKYKMASFTELVALVRNQNQEARAELIDAISTHETLFFRDSSLFQALKFKVLPELLDAKENSRRKDLRIWSAACSTGQEVYSIAMLLKELEIGNDWNVSIIGTDISDKAVARAQAGVYADHEVQRGLDNPRLFRFFDKHEKNWRVTSEIRRWCKFQTHNLLKRAVGMGPFDLILCRNVLIYFDAEAKRQVVSLLVEQLDPAGYFIVGGSENLMEYGPQYTPHSHCGGVFYQPKFNRPQYI